jgi:chromosome segregation ATPase
MSSISEFAFGTSAAAVLAALWAFLRSSSGKAIVSRIRKSVVSETQSLRAALDNLAQVVETQGHSIEWLREELTNTRRDLEDARSALNDKENRLEVENEKLRKRVAELEAQVKALEEALAKRTRTRKSTTGGKK